jgi:predicted nucleotidyltransferase
MKTKESILQVLRSMKSDLASQYHVRSLALFGSYSRGDQTEQSDVDILVEFETPISGLKFVNLAEAIEHRVGLPADVVPADGVKPHHLKFIQKDLVYV